MGSSYAFDSVSGYNVIAGTNISDGGTLNVYNGSPHPPANQTSQPLRAFSNVPFPPDDDYIDRPRILTWLREKCARPAARAALVGLGGVGKSQIAIRYAHQVQQSSPNTYVFWVHASTRERFKEAYQYIAKRLQLPGYDNPKIDILRLVADWLSDENHGKWCLFVDNADDASVFYSAQHGLASFLPKTSHGTIVITSRSMDAAERLVGGFRNIYEVPPMESEEAHQLLRQKLEDDHYNETAATNLIQALDNIPLAITQAAAFINRRAPLTSLSKYLDEFKKNDTRKKSLLNKDAGDLRRDETASNSIVSTWQITFDQIHQDSPSAANLLCFMSLFNPQGIPEYMLQAYMEEQAEEDSFCDDIEVLRGYALVSITVNTKVFEMHSLVQFCTRVWLSSFDSLMRWEMEFLQLMVKHYPEATFENWAQCQELDPHAEEIIKTKPTNDQDLHHWADLLSAIWDHRRERGRYREAEALSRQALDANIGMFGQNHHRVYDGQIRLGLSLHGQGKYEEAASILLQALEGHKQEFGEKHRKTLTAIHHYARVLRRLGTYAEAEKLYRQVLVEEQKLFGVEDDATLCTMHQLALTLNDQSKHDEAEQLLRRHLEIGKGLYGENPSKNLPSRSQLAVALYNQGKCKEAEQISRESLELSKAAFGMNHPHTLYLMQNVAKMVCNGGQHEEAEAMHRQLILMRKKVIGPNHPDTLISMDDLACSLKNQGKLEEAEEICRTVLEKSKKELGERHEDTISRFLELAIILHKRNQNIEASVLSKAAHRGYLQALGPDHPTTIGCWEFYSSLTGGVSERRHSF